MQKTASTITPTLIPTLMLTGFTILSGLVLSSTIVSADDSAVDQVSITVPSSCTMSGSGMNSHNSEIVNGTYQADIGTTTLHAFCNDNEGFAIYAAGYTGNEVGGENSNKLVGTNASNNATIESGTATTAGNPDVSNWAMKLAIAQDSGDTTGTNAYTIDSAPNTSGGADASFGQYHVVPNKYTKVAHKNSNTDMTDTTGGVKLTTTYAAYISKTQPADTYSGQVIYTLVHPASTEAPLSPQQATAGCINYFANASNAVGTMGCQSATDGNTITLLASNFSRDGYGFAGWSDKYDYATNPNANLYGPQEDITVPTGTTANGLSLYAIWIKSEGSIQDTTKVAEVCNRLTQSGPNVTKTLASVSALTDQRDNETYAIAKLADGNCWMIENLRLENTGTDNTNGSLAQGYNASFAGLADPEAPSLFNDVTTANTLYSTDGSTDKTISGGYQSSRFPRYNNINTPTTTADRPTNPTTNSASNSTSLAGMYSYGNYYTWHAAIANTTFYYNGDHNTTSICPTGWHLPTGTSSGEFRILNTAINSNATNYTASRGLRKYPNNIIYSGVILHGSISNRGSGGNYWSSTAYATIDAYRLSFYESSVSPGTSLNGDVGNMYNGLTVRCLTPNV